LLAREGTGIAAWRLHDAGRDQCEIFQQLEIGECKDAEQISACWQSGLPAWMALSTLSPAMAGLLNIRKELVAQLHAYTGEVIATVHHTRIATDVVHTSRISDDFV
jgi:uncharacterized membrane protein